MCKNNCIFPCLSIYTVHNVGPKKAEGFHPVWQQQLATDHKLDCTVIHCSALLYTALLYTALHCYTLHCTVIHCTALSYSALYCLALHCTALHCIALLYTTALLQITALHCTALHWSTLQCIVAQYLPANTALCCSLENYLIAAQRFPGSSLQATRVGC